jgi:thiamine-phosphate pyrophosphorylase
MKGQSLANERGTLARAAYRLNVGPLPPLVLMTDDERLPDPCAAASQLPRGSLIVLRARQKRRREKLAAALAGIARSRGLFLLIADDPELARSADGAHFPEAHMGAISHWRARRPDWFLTTSAHSLQAVQRAAGLGADAVFLSPVFPTKSHVGIAPLTPIRFRRMARDARVPLYALGGIDAGNVRQLAGIRLAGIAAIGALSV